MKPKNKNKGSGSKNSKDASPGRSRKDTGSKKDSAKKESESQVEMVPQVLKLKPNKEILESTQHINKSGATVDPSIESFLK